jgi:hypothetical protein
MNSNEPSIISETSSMPSAELSAKLKKERIQVLTNKLTYIHDLSPYERDFLLQELQALEQSLTTGI